MQTSSPPQVLLLRLRSAPQFYTGRNSFSGHTSTTDRAVRAMIYSPSSENNNLIQRKKVHYHSTHSSSSSSTEALGTTLCSFVFILLFYATLLGFFSINPITRCTPYSRAEEDPFRSLPLHHHAALLATSFLLTSPCVCRTVVQLGAKSGQKLESATSFFCFRKSLFDLRYKIVQDLVIF